MKSTNAADRVRRNREFDQFCTPERKMVYEPINFMDQMDAVLWSERKPFEKLYGIGKIISVPGNFGSKPVIPVEKEKVDFVHELATLCAGKGAILFRFRNQLMYWPVVEPEKLEKEESVKRNKPHVAYLVPITSLKPV